MKIVICTYCCENEVDINANALCACEECLEDEEVQADLAEAIRLEEKSKCTYPKCSCERPCLQVEI